MSVFSHPEFAGHESVYFCCDRPSGLKAIIAIHDTTAGPSLGGCRMFPYASDDEALQDVLRLSRGMSFKSAISRLPLGGGKSVIIGDPHRDKTDTLLHAMGRAVEQLGGRYIVAEDSGTGVQDMRIMSAETRHVAGIVDDDPERDGDPSPSTALGVFVGLKEAVRRRMDTDDLSGLRVGIQGLGNVGQRLAWYLHEAGAKIWASEIYQPSIDAATAELPLTMVPPDQLFALDLDVISPCAMGAVLNVQSIPRIKARVVAGAANNQLAHPDDGLRLVDAGILYAPDYVINAGGVIDVYYQVTRQPLQACRDHILTIDDNLREVFERAEKDGCSTQDAADAIARERFEAAQHSA